MNDCSGLYLMITLASALPAIFCSVAIILTLLMLDKLNGRDAWLLILIVSIVAFVPLAIDYIFKEKMPGNLNNCLISLIKKQQPSQQQKIQGGGPPSLPVPTKMQRPPMMVQQKPIHPIQPPRTPTMYSQEMYGEDDDAFLRNAGLL